jgi:hypothetical protein
MIRNYNHLSYHEIFLDHQSLKVPGFGRRSNKRGKVPYRFHN